MLHLIPSAKALFTNKVMFTSPRGWDLDILFEGDIEPTTWVEARDAENHTTQHGTAPATKRQRNPACPWVINGDCGWEYLLVYLKASRQLSCGVWPSTSNASTWQLSLPCSRGWMIMSNEWRPSVPSRWHSNTQYNQGWCANDTKGKELMQLSEVCVFWYTYNTYLVFLFRMHIKNFWFSNTGLGSKYLWLWKPRGKTEDIVCILI